MAARWWMLAVVFLTRTATGVQFQALAAVSPLVATDLGLSYAQVGWLVGLYMLPGVVISLPGAVIGERLGERRVVLLSLAVMVIGALITAASDGFLLAAAGRALAGAGGIPMSLLLTTMMAAWFAGRELATAMGLLLTSWPVGLGLAGAAVAPLGAVTSWRAAIAASAIVAVVGLVLMRTVYRDPPGARGDAPAAPRPRLTRREIGLAVVAGLAWGVYNASLIVLMVFGPGLLFARGAPLAEANATVSLTIWVTLLSVPLGGLVADRWQRTDVPVVACLVLGGGLVALLPCVPWAAAVCLAGGLVGGAPAAALISLLPRAVRAEAVTRGFGIVYAVYYLVLTLTQPVAGAIRDATGSPAAPLIFTAVLMVATILPLATFRALERTAPVTRDTVQARRP